jgi:hypothetical protein
MALTTNFATEEALDGHPSDGHSGGDHPNVEERRALIERIAGSAHFRRSARLRDFLLYVGLQSLREDSHEIHEQEIGAKVFGRDASYDRSQDNIVRVNATELRKRIDLYFATEGADEPLILEIPRGGYKPVFHRRLPVLNPTIPEAEPLLERPAPAPVSANATPRSNRANLVWATICAALAIACLLLFQQNRAMRKALSPLDGKPAIAAFWENFLRTRQQTDLVLPDDSISIIVDLARRSIPLQDYLNHNYMREIQASNLSPDRKVDLDNISSHNLVTFGGVRAAQQILALVPASGSPNLTLARYYQADAIKRDNVILIGGMKANPWVHLFEGQLNFITDFDAEHSQAMVRNRNPKPGEQSVYLVSHDPDTLVGYSAIAFLPNPGRTGNVIILAGTDSDATSAAAEFLTSEDQLQKFRNSLNVEKFPYFEVLLKTSRLSGTSFNADVLAYRIYPDRH